MDNVKTIGLMGAIVNNDNMGCVALTYSIISCLEKISKKINTKFNYIIFDISCDEKKNEALCKNLGLSKEQISWAPVGYIHKLTSRVKYYKRNNAMTKAIDKCNIVIDLTQGDSFTDIYGQERFDIFTKIKELVEKRNIPLVLGPQTYGPFNKDKNKSKAKRVIENASLVISRDKLSAEYLSDFCSCKTYITTDLAFMLPYKKAEKNCGEKIKIGVNVSGLLLKNKGESTKTEFTLKTDYDEYIETLLGLLLKNPLYEVHLIPHVGEDGVKQMADKIPSAIAHKKFITPIDAKNCIAEMDIFIGARMHATVAAFSTGVTTIPTAYSRKFAGLFNNLGYNYVVDMQSLSTKDALAQTLIYIDNYKKIGAVAKECMEEIEAQSDKTMGILEEFITEQL